MIFLKHFARKYSTPASSRTFQEVKIPVPWGHVAGKWWNPSDKRPILTLHGWQDNCGSFDRLIPLLTQDVGFLAIDLPGHGYSSQLPQGMYYHNMNYPILIKQIKHYFNWPTISLMGHSLGAISCYMYSMLFPDSVDFLVCIDGVKPLQKADNLPRMAKGIDELLKFDDQLRATEEPPSYTMEELKQIMGEVNFRSIEIEHCHHILNRNIAPSKTNPGKYYFTRDPRLKSRLILNWPHEELVESGKRATFPMFMSKSIDSPYYENKQNFYDLLEVLKKTSADCQYYYVEGTHHVLLNNPQVLYKLINDFIAKHNKQDRSGGGIGDEIKANDL